VRIATPAPIPVLAERLAGFGADFAADREWRYGMFTLDGQRVLGEVSLFSRAERGRVPLAEADRAEIGYWLRSDETGRGLVTEAARAVLDVARTVPQFGQVEIRCDARNAASAAVPPRLGFVLAETIEEAPVASTDVPVQLQVWTLAVT
jgi:RimJ/RimL family protein N-acetyltransferase